MVIFQKVVVKPIQVKKFYIGYGGKRLSRNSSRRNIIDDIQSVPRDEAYDHVPHRHSVNVFHPQQQIFDNIESDKGVKLPPVTQMVPHNGKVSLVHKWSTAASPHIRDIRNKNQIRTERNRRHSEPLQKRPDDNSFNKVKTTRYIIYPIYDEIHCGTYV